jgi:hypothetical protein
MMEESEIQQAKLIKRLSEFMPEGDVQTMVRAALQPEDMMTRKMAELLWDNLPLDTKTKLGNSLETFLDEVEHESKASFISPAAQKHIRLRNEKTWD